MPLDLDNSERRETLLLYFRKKQTETKGKIIKTLEQKKIKSTYQLVVCLAEGMRLWVWWGRVGLEVMLSETPLPASILIWLALHTGGHS